MKQWKCSICGYVHSGEEPPDTCPLCGADKSEFFLLEEEVQEQASDSVDSKSSTEEEVNQTKDNNTNNNFSSSIQPFKEKIDKLILKHHLHPISVHIPNGVIPVSVFLLMTGYFFKNQSLMDAAYYNISFVFIFMPVVLYTGYVEWINNYKKADTGKFRIKISSAFITALTAAVICLWKSFSPEESGMLFFIFNFVMLISAGVAGHIGGNLVFKK